jgi:4-amino-4-deoxy-L-arabinose transferase-like glycosyltransferase
MYQNQHSPWAEWTILHLVLLQGNERAANFVQWTSFIGCLVAVSLLAEKCGGSKRAGILAAFLAATLPMAILQASSTQNDLALAFWLLSFAYGCLQIAENPSWPRLIFCGITLGLAMLISCCAADSALPCRACSLSR